MRRLLLPLIGGLCATFLLSGCALFYQAALTPEERAAKREKALSRGDWTVELSAGTKWQLRDTRVGGYDAISAKVGKNSQLAAYLDVADFGGPEDEGEAGDVDIFTGLALVGGWGPHDQIYSLGTAPSAFRSELDGEQRFWGGSLIGGFDIALGCGCYWRTYLGLGGAYRKIEGRFPDGTLVVDGADFVPMFTVGTGLFYHIWGNWDVGVTVDYRHLGGFNAEQFGNPAKIGSSSEWVAGLGVRYTFGTDAILTY